MKWYESYHFSQSEGVLNVDDGIVTLQHDIGDVRIDLALVYCLRMSTTVEMSDDCIILILYDSLGNVFGELIIPGVKHFNLWKSMLHA